MTHVTLPRLSTTGYSLQVKQLPQSGKATENLRLVFLETPGGLVFHGADRLAGNTHPVNPGKSHLHDAATAAALALVIAKARWLSVQEASLADFKVKSQSRRLLLIAETRDAGNWITTVWTGFSNSTPIEPVFAGASNGWNALIASGGRTRKSR